MMQPVLRIVLVLPVVLGLYTPSFSQTQEKSGVVAQGGMAYPFSENLEGKAPMLGVALVVPQIYTSNSVGSLFLHYSRAEAKDVLVETQGGGGEEAFALTPLSVWTAGLTYRGRWDRRIASSGPFGVIGLGLSAITGAKPEDADAPVEVSEVVPNGIALMLEFGIGYELVFNEHHSLLASLTLPVHFGLDRRGDFNSFNYHVVVPYSAINLALGYQYLGYKEKEP